MFIHEFLEQYIRRGMESPEERDMRSAEFVHSVAAEAQKRCDAFFTFCAVALTSHFSGRGCSWSLSLLHYRL